MRTYLPTRLSSCYMEEADERIFVNVKHASREHTCIIIKAADSDVVVIAIANFHQLVQEKLVQKNR